MSVNYPAVIPLAARLLRLGVPPAAVLHVLGGPKPTQMPVPVPMPKMLARDWVGTVGIRHVGDGKHRRRGQRGLETKSMVVGTGSYPTQPPPRKP